MWDGRKIYFYKNEIFFFRTSKDWWYFSNSNNEYIGMCKSNFESANKFLDIFNNLTKPPNL